MKARILTFMLSLFCFLSFHKVKGAISLDSSKQEITSSKYLERSSKKDTKIRLKLKKKWQKLRQKAGKKISKLAIGAILMGIGLLIGIIGVILSASSLVYILAGGIFLVGCVLFVWDVVQIMS